ncbi:MAG: hypothetical protein J6B89_03900 [Bacilli bacterium]|nr:hypothetical protein [Bacilli bacterium]
MVTILVISLIVLVLIMVLFGYFKTHVNKVKKINIKILEAESQIKQLLNKKDELLISAKDHLGNDCKALDGIDDVCDISNNDFEYYDFLGKYYKRFDNFISDDDFDASKLEDDSIEKISVLLKEEEEALSGCIRYYNDTAGEYNDLISNFPIKLISFICGYKHLSLFSIDNKSGFNTIK